MQFILKLNYLKFDLHLNDKYKFLIDISVALFGFLTIFILIQQQKADHMNIRNEESKLYNKIVTEMFTDSLNDFISNTEIQYFYNVLFKNDSPPSSPDTRKIILEEIIVNKMLSSYGNYAAYYYSHINLSEYKQLLIKHNSRIKKILNILLKSPTFKTYLNEYLQNIAGEDFIEFMKEHFNYSIN